MPPVKFHVLPGLASIPGAPNGNVPIYKPNLWTPGQLGAALAFWYRMNVNVTSAANRVSSIGAVLTGVGPTLVQATGANQPLLTAASNGLLGVKSDGGNVFIQGSLNGLGITDSTPFSLCAAYQVDNTNRYSNATITLGVYSGMGIAVYPGTNGGAGGSGHGTAVVLGSAGYSTALTVDLPAPAAATGAVEFLGISYDGSARASGLTMYQNGQPVAPFVFSDGASVGQNTAALATGDLILGFARAPGFDDANDLVLELFGANRVMSPNDHANAYAYFTQQV